MKKTKLLLSIAIGGSVILFSCGGDKKTSQEPPKIQNAKWGNEFANAPKWVLNPQSEGVLSAVGSAKIGKAGIQFAKIEALANARDELARQLSVKVKNMIKNFTQQIGVGDDQTVDKVAVQVSKQVTSQVLQGSKQKDMWISPSGELYVLVILDPTSVKDAIKQATISSFKNYKALWQKFQAKQAFDELDREIKKLYQE